MRDELTDIKNVKEKYRIGIMFGDVFGFAEHQMKAAMD